MAASQWLVSSQTSAGYPELEKEFKDNIVYTPQDSATFLVGTNIDRQSYKYTSKTTDEQKTSTKKSSPKQRLPSSHRLWF